MNYYEKFERPCQIITDPVQIRGLEITGQIACYFEKIFLGAPDTVVRFVMQLPDEKYNKYLVGQSMIDAVRQPGATVEDTLKIIALAMTLYDAGLVLKAC